MSTRQRYDVRVELNHGCITRDGVRLSTDVFLPVGEGPWPVVSIRTPYGNNDPVKKVPLGRAFASCGYAVVIQDVRGRYDSEGDWEPFFNEALDGLDAQAWLADQPFCNGEIALMGRSYEGYCVWMSAFDHHPAVKAIVPIVALPDPVINVPWQNGSIFWTMITWALFVHGRTNQDVSSYNWELLYKHRPLNELPAKLGIDSRMWTDWLTHPTKDAYWERACYMHRMNELDLPALHVCGWYDDDGASTYNNFPAARKLAKSKDDQHVLIGPWPHATNTRSVVPGVDFGSEEVIDLNGYIMDFLDCFMGESSSPPEPKPRARIFLMGENRWRDFGDWPPGVVDTSYFLRSGGNANSMLGDGLLSLERPAVNEPPDTYEYDPDDPTPYLYDAGTLQVGGPFDARPVQRRDDVLCYTSGVLQDDVVICGRVFAELYVSTSAADTEFCAMLCDVHPNGLSRQLCDGNIRLALRDSLAKPDPVTPGDVVRIEVDMWATGVRIFAGHRIRLQLASAALPKFAVHTNTLDPPGEAVTAVIAANTVYHDPDRLSCLRLPIVPNVV